MNIDNVKLLWGEDSKMDISELAEESSKICRLHSKYYNIYVDEKLKLRKLESDHKILKRLKYEYYLGKLSPEQIKTLNWEPFELKIIRSELDVYIDSDQHLNESMLAIQTQEELVWFVESIIKSISSRGFHIKSAVDFLRWTQG